MILHSPKYLTRLSADICVVGSGPAGLGLALALEDRGQSVLVLESGSDQASSTIQELAEADIPDPARHDPMSIATARRLGGTSHLWGARCQPFDLVDFKPNPRFRSAEWPISLDEINPYYPEACRFLDCGEAKFTRSAFDRDISKEFSVEHIERFSNSPKVSVAHKERINTSTRVTVCLNASVVDIGFDGMNVQTVTLKTLDGQSTTLTVRILVLAGGGIETTRILLSAQQKKTDLCGGINGPLGRYYMGHIIGEVADIHIEDERLDKILDLTLDPGQSFVRHRMIPAEELQIEKGLPNVAFWPVVPPVSQARHRDGVLSMVFLTFAFAPLGRRLVPEAIRLRHVPPGVKVWPHIQNVLRSPIRTLTFAPKLLWQRYAAKMRMPGFYLRNRARVYGLSYHAEQSPQPGSRITLADTADRLGLPRVRIDLRFARQDAEALFTAHEALDNWLRQNRLGRIDYRQPKEKTVDAILKIASHGTHQIGTTRMGNGPDEGAVDKNLRCFGTENLFVCSSAVFPTSGQCNPTLSIVAFALRLAEHLAGSVNSK